ncbi:MAG: alcohol dehydrogenase catalytic domain-containing protein [Acidobacteriia bacterium]|nr:alcohol dehydrogenase catalytic domain-containing protein [Terriglobia bacterium]
MLAARLHGPSDLRLEEVPHPGPPGRGEVLLRVRTTALCGSDLHSYRDARIGDTGVKAPLILGHEFSGVVEAAGADSLDGNFAPIRPGTRVAVDPAQPCGRCALCQKGHPNLCCRLHFCGNYPDDGSLCEWMLMPGRSCFPVPETIDDVAAALLEPVGVAIHAADLARIRAASSAAILGAGPIGLLILQVAKLAGADPIFVTDRLPWRLELARKIGGVPINFELEDSTRLILKLTGGLGVDTAIEAAWGEESVAQAAEIARPGGRIVLVGIPSDDTLAMKHSTARRKGLTILLSRRMKHVYPRALRLVEHGRVDVRGLVSHRFPLRQAADAFRLNTEYRDHVNKVIIDIGP